MELVNRKLSELTPSPFNPPSRTMDTVLRTLLRSIKEHGIQQPLLVSTKGQIIDGHRRYACAKALNLETVPVVISDDSGDSVAKKFETVNTHMKKLGPKDMIFVYANKGAVPDRIANKIAALETLLGADRLDEISTLDVSYYVGDVAGRISEYCGKSRDQDFKRRACNWLIDHHMSWRANRSMEDGVPPKVLIMAIQRNRPLSRSWGISEPSKRGKHK